MSGGSGTRLWPLSTREVPKQFASLLDGGSLFSMTMERLIGLEHLRSAIIVTGSQHLESVMAAVGQAPVDVSSIIVEPIGRNTAPAAVAAALVANPDDVLVILPSDHLIADVAGFQSAVEVAATLAMDGGIVTFGITPTRAETGYGYIEMGDPVGAARRVARFKEKPDRAEAGRLLADGRHLWNSGMFVVRADHLLAEADRYVGQILVGVRGALPPGNDHVVELGPGFGNVEAVSFDHALMERTSKALVVPLDVGWSDVGSFASLHEVSAQDGSGNAVSGEVTLDDVHRSFVRATSRRLVVAGLDDVVVVETPDAVLVLPMDRAQDVKDLQPPPTV